MKYAETFPYGKFKGKTADLTMLGWPEDVPIVHSSAQSFMHMKIVLDAIKENKISFVVPGTDAVGTTSESRSTE